MIRCPWNRNRPSPWFGSSEGPPLGWCWVECRLLRKSSLRLWRWRAFSLPFKTLQGKYSQTAQVLVNCLSWGLPVYIFFFLSLKLFSSPFVVKSWTCFTSTEFFSIDQGRKVLYFCKHGKQKHFFKTIGHQNCRQNFLIDCSPLCRLVRGGGLMAHLDQLCFAMKEKRNGKKRETNCGRIRVQVARGKIEWLLNGLAYCSIPSIAGASSRAVLNASYFFHNIFSLLSPLLSFSVKEKLNVAPESSVRPLASLSARSHFVRMVYTTVTHLLLVTWNTSHSL